MVIVWNSMVAFANNYIIWNALKVQSDMVHFIVCGIVGILLPIAGWLADVWLGRYKVILYKIDNLRFYKSLVHTYWIIIMNDLGLDRNVFCQSS